MSSTVFPSPLSRTQDDDIKDFVHNILNDSDLQVLTYNRIQLKVNEKYNMDCSHHKENIKEIIEGVYLSIGLSTFLSSLYNYSVWWLSPLQLSTFYSSFNIYILFKPIDFVTSKIEDEMNSNDISEAEDHMDTATTSPTKAKKNNGNPFYSL